MQKKKMKSKVYASAKTRLKEGDIKLRVDMELYSKFLKGYLAALLLLLINLLYHGVPVSLQNNLLINQHKP